MLDRDPWRSMYGVATKCTLQSARSSAPHASSVSRLTSCSRLAMKEAEHSCVGGHNCDLRMRGSHNYGSNRPHGLYGARA